MHSQHGVREIRTTRIYTVRHHGRQSRCRSCNYCMLWIPWCFGTALPRNSCKLVHRRTACICLLHSQCKSSRPGYSYIFRRHTVDTRKDRIRCSLSPLGSRCSCSALRRNEPASSSGTPSENTFQEGTAQGSALVSEVMMATGSARASVRASVGRWALV